MNPHPTPLLIGFEDICKLTSEALLTIRMISRSNNINSETKIQLIDQLTQESHFYPDVLNDCFSTENQPKVNINILANYNSLRELIDKCQKITLG